MIERVQESGECGSQKSECTPTSEVLCRLDDYVKCQARQVSLP